MNVGDEIIILKYNTNGNIERETAQVDKNYEVVIRYWETSNGDRIREWNVDEYINCNPQNKKIIPYTIADKTVNVEAHCSEMRQVYATKNGRRVTSFYYKVDYSKDNNTKCQ
ncbi:MAG: hypothetical protein II453_17900 [Alphaproteobacteria bacterium]|nr:hypothetical protein [Alphaproteobacteria bacterium]